jgi:hypothetical protein
VCPCEHPLHLQERLSNQLAQKQQLRDAIVSQLEEEERSFKELDATAAALIAKARLASSKLMVGLGLGLGLVWCGVGWVGVVWCGVVWCGVVWCGVVWCGVVWCGVVWGGVGWGGVVWGGVGWVGVG